MDRLDAMKVFVAALDEGSLAAAARRLARSPAAVSRAIAFLEAHVGTELLHRTTRTMKLSEAGAHYAAACRRVLADLEEAELSVLSERTAPRGTVTITAPPISGEEILRPIVDAYLEAYPAVSVNLVLLDRSANLVEEGIDVALRLGDLPDSSMIAVRIGGNVKRVVVASPSYLARHPRIDEPADLAKHQIVTTTYIGQNSWVFPPAAGSSIARVVHFKPRLVVNSVRAALASAVGGLGVTRLYTYHVAEHVQDGALTVLLRDAEPPTMPVHLVTPQGRTLVPKVRAFMDFAAPLLRKEFARLSAEAGVLTH
ncbi:LysR substrate-binding domain-containing protein [Bosea sp. LjRoot9]|uniref:LysR substrate-binding domain-containing protein n=1 Tax=Bosea sp. LjRoot9 TaxID=3342341 RepID=UPI003ECD5AF8